MSDGDYARLLGVRTRLREFERWSAGQAAAHGLTAAQHQLLLAVRGHRAATGEDPTVRQAADYLLTRHHSVVELVDRCARAGLVERERDPEDGRAVRLRLTDSGEQVLGELSAAHLAELSELVPLFESLLDTLNSP